MPRNREGAGSRGAGAPSRSVPFLRGNVPILHGERGQLGTACGLAETRRKDTRFSRPLMMRLARPTRRSCEKIKLFKVLLRADVVATCDLTGGQSFDARHAAPSRPGKCIAGGGQGFACLLF